MVAKYLLPLRYFASIWLGDSLVLRLRCKTGFRELSGNVRSKYSEQRLYDLFRYQLGA